MKGDPGMGGHANGRGDDGDERDDDERRDDDEVYRRMAERVARGLVER